MPALRPCGPERETSLGVVEVELWRGEGVTEEEGRALGDDLKLVWSRLGLEVKVRSNVRVTGLRQAYPAGDELKDPRRMLREPDEGVIHLVGLVEVVDPASRLRRTLGEVHGLTLRAGEALPGVEVSQHPTALFVEVSELRSPRPGARRFTAAHELGHALGLEHEANRKNLMQTGWFECIPELTPAQADIVGRFGRPPTSK